MRRECSGRLGRHLWRGAAEDSHELPAGVDDSIGVELLTWWMVQVERPFLSILLALRLLGDTAPAHARTDRCG